MSKSYLTFRAQLVIPEQREVFEYWLSCRGDREMPARADIAPRGMKRHLSMISLYDVTSAKDFRVRLAGTGLREIFSRDLTGATTGDIPGDLIKPLRRVVKTASPTQGVAPVNDPDRDNLIQFWLRLPLSDNGKSVNMILGFDHFLPAEKAIELTRAYALAQAS